MDKNTPLYDTRLTDRERAEYLVSRMTLEEKFDCFGLRIRMTGASMEPLLIWALPFPPAGERAPTACRRGPGRERPIRRLRPPPLPSLSEWRRPLTGN